MLHSFFTSRNTKAPTEVEALIILVSSELYLKYRFRLYRSMRILCVQMFEQSSFLFFLWAITKKPYFQSRNFLYYSKNQRFLKVIYTTFCYFCSNVALNFHGRKFIMMNSTHKYSSISVPSSQAVRGTFKNLGLSDLSSVKNTDNTIPKNENNNIAINTDEKILSSLKVDRNTSIKFSELKFYEFDRLNSSEFNSFVINVHSATKRYDTIENYRKYKNYPSGIDIRPHDFNPLRCNDLAAHGTNCEALLSATINCNLQIVPQRKQFKLQGKQPETGESASSGVHRFNYKYVSTVGLGNLNSSFRDVIRYAEYASSRFKTTPDNSINNMPVVIVGDGVNKIYPGYSSISNEIGYKRLNIRIAAFKNEEDRNKIMELLKVARNEMGIFEVDTLRFCTFSDLQAHFVEYPIIRPNSTEKVKPNLNLNLPNPCRPDIFTLWKNSKRL